jgi:uncharacterized protein YrrD
MPVIGLEGAQRLGTVDGLLLDLKNQRVLGLRVKTRSFLPGHRAMLLEDITSVGQDAVTVADATKLVDEKKLPAFADAADMSAVDRARVLNESGTVLGTVSDLEVDLNSGAITQYILSGSLIDGLRHREHVVPVAEVRSAGEKLIVVVDD